MQKEQFEANLLATNTQNQLDVLDVLENVNFVIASFVLTR